MRELSRRLLILSLALGVVLCTGGIASAGVMGQQDTAVYAQTSPASAVAPQNNSSVAQENPDTVEESGDSDALKRYLAQQLSRRLQASTREVNQGQYDRARKLLGDQYTDTLRKYVDVAGGTNRGASGNEFQQAQETQRSFVTSVQRYNSTYQQYREAKQRGNETRAHQLARDLDRQARNATGTGENLSKQYDEVGNSSGIDVTESQRQIEQVIQNISERQQSVVSEEFERTVLSVSAATQTASFRAPLPIVGRLQTEDGTALANRTVRFDVGGQRLTTVTNRTGGFSLSYRPVVAPLSKDRVTVQYIPRRDSVYLGANGSVPLDVRQTTASISVMSNTSEAGFSDPLTIQGRVEVRGTPVNNAEVRITVDGVLLGVVRTTRGDYRLSSSLPARVTPGERPIRVRVSGDDRAVTSNVSSTTLHVVSTATKLTMTARPVGNSTLLVNGSLETIDGRTLTGQPVQILANGRTVETANTNAEGDYRTSVSLPGENASTLRMKSVYSGDGTNLEKTTATTTLDFSPTQSGGIGFSNLPLPLTIGGGLLLVALLAAGGIVVRSQREEPTFAPNSRDPESTASAEVAVADRLLDQARDRLKNEEWTYAVESAYTATRHGLAESHSLDKTGTHWEFFNEASSHMDKEIADQLRVLTELYETCIYGPSGENDEAANQAVSAASEIILRMKM